MKTAATIGTVIILALVGLMALRGWATRKFDQDTIEPVDPPAGMAQLIDPVKPVAAKSSSWAVRALRVVRDEDR